MSKPKIHKRVQAKHIINGEKLYHALCGKIWCDETDDDTRVTCKACLKAMAAKLVEEG